MKIELKFRGVVAQSLQVCPIRTDEKGILLFSIVTQQRTPTIAALNLPSWMQRCTNVLQMYAYGDDEYRDDFDCLCLHLPSKLLIGVVCCQQHYVYIVGRWEKMQSPSTEWIESVVTAVMQWNNYPYFNVKRSWLSLVWNDRYSIFIEASQFHRCELTTTK